MVIRRKKERGAALIEAAVTIPIILLICVAIFDLGRAYQTWQVVTNAAREGARVSVIAGNTDADVRAAVARFMEAGIGKNRLKNDGWSEAHVVLDRNMTLGANNASQVTVQYPFSFMVLGPIMKMVTPSSTRGNALSMGAVAAMRNEN